MNQKSKRMLAGVLLVGVGVVWIPQIVAAVNRPPPVVRPEISALGLGAPLASGTPTSPAPQEHASPDTQAEVAHDDLAGALEKSLSGVRSLSTDRPGLDLEELLSAPVREPAIEPVKPESAPVAPAVVPLSLRAPDPTFDTLPDPIPILDPLEQFLATHPLQGTLIGTSERLAYLGPRIARVGDELLPGLVVTAIEPRRVTFRHDGRSLHLDLVPFEARARTAPAGGTGASLGVTPDTAGAGATLNGGGASASMPPESTKLLQQFLEAASKSGAHDTTAPASTAPGAQSATRTNSGLPVKEGASATTEEPHGP